MFGIKKLDRETYRMILFDLLVLALLYERRDQVRVLVRRIRGVDGGT